MGIKSKQKDEQILIQRVLLGTIPATYPTICLRGVKVYDNELWQNVINTLNNIKRLDDKMKEFYSEKKELRETAEELGLLDELDRCVYSAFDVQLNCVQFPIWSRCGVNNECSHWKHRGKVFTEYLRSSYFADEVLQYGLMIIIPDELEEKLKQ